MYCVYCGCDCIIPLQIENGCEDCELKSSYCFESDFQEDSLEDSPELYKIFS